MAISAASAGWILASASPRRRELLSALGIHCRIDPSTTPEPPLRLGESPRAYAVRAARAKAVEAARKHRAGLIIAADTIVVAEDRILGKPCDEQDARGMLRRLSGRWHDVITGLCLLDCRTRRSRSACAISRVRFRRLSRSELSWYLATGEYHDKAGAYAIQGYASLFIDRIEGCYFNVVGFPISTFYRLCLTMGIDLKSGRRTV